jgi:hypothetical protein
MRYVENNISHCIILDTVMLNNIAYWDDFFWNMYINIVFEDTAFDEHYTTH